MSNTALRSFSLLGGGSIGASILQAWQAAPIPGFRLDAVCLRSHQIATTRTILPDMHLVTHVDDLVARNPHVIIEAAGQAAIVAHAPHILSSGIDLYILSVGALGDDELRARLTSAAQEGGSRILIPSGALAGLDGLRAISRIGGAGVTYISRKPPRAWRGTPAEAIADLETLTQPIEFFRGSARQAACDYPQNANLAASVALAGIGFDRTEVRLIADPHITENIARLEAQAGGTRLVVETSNEVFKSNPKSSRTTGLSALAALCNETAELSFV